MRLTSKSAPDILYWTARTVLKMWSYCVGRAKRVNRNDTFARLPRPIALSCEIAESLARNFKHGAFEEALINTYRMYTVLYDMTLKDYKNEKMKLNVWEKIAEELQHVKGCCVQGMGVDEHLYMPTVWLVNHDTSWYMVWKPDKSHCCMFLFSLCTLRFEFDCVFAAYLPLGRWSPCRWALATQW